MVKFYTSADPTQAYDFIQPSNNSWDGGQNKINIVDYILDGRLGAGDHTYKLVNGTTSTNPVETWFANGAVSVISDEIAGYANSNTFGYYTKNAQNTPVTNQIFSGPDNYSTPAKFSPSAQRRISVFTSVCLEIHIIQKIRLTPTMKSMQRSFKSIIPTLISLASKICALLIPMGTIRT